MLKRILTILLTSLSLAVFAQNQRGDGKIVGTLVDSTAGVPVEFATLSLFKLPNSTQPMDGTMTDEKGKFELSNLAYGDYIIRFSFIGYSDKTSKTIKVSADQKTVNLNNVLLASSAKVLNEVQVVGQAALIEEKVDRLVFNADKDITSKGGDATEILRKVPLLSVDLDGNVQLRGSSSIKVLINNKPSTIMATSVADALRQIPADQVKTVEVITSPSAKYDAEGATGIVNIITKKNNLEGYSLSVDLGAGNRGGNLGLNGNLKIGKLGFTLGGWGRANNNPSKSDFFQTGIAKNLGDTTYSTRQLGDGKDKMMFGRYSLGVNYDISNSKSLSAGARLGGFSWGRDQDLTINEFVNINGVETPTRTSQLAVTNSSPNVNMDFNLDYLNVIAPQKEFSISSLYSRSNSHSTFSRTPMGGSEGMGFENINDGINQEFTLQTDYMTPLKANQSLEMGAKGIYRIVDSDFENISILGANRFSSKGNMNYDQSISAAYLGYTLSTASKYTFKVGGRYEYTDISARTLGVSSESQVALSIPSYGNFIPSINLSKPFGKYTVKLAYNQRIQRPGLQFLNPNENTSNPLRISRGNPELSPELSNNIEAGLSAGINKLYFNLSVFTRFTDNAISSLTTKFEERGPGVTLTTFENVGKSNTSGVNLFGNYQITSKWTLNGGLEAFHMNYKGLAPNLDGLSMDFNSQGWNLNGRLMSQMTLNKGWQIQGFGFMRGNSVIAQGTQSGWGHYALGFRKEFANKKGSIGLNLQNFLKDKMTFTSSLHTFQNIQESIDYRYNRGISLTFNYKLGKMGPDSFKNRRSVKNDDLKDGGGQDQQGGGQQ